MIAKTHRKNAERAAEHVLHEIYDCTHTVRAVATQYQRQDMFACDVIGLTVNCRYYVQVTCGKTEAIRTRRRKLEDKPWIAGVDCVMVWQFVETPDPVRASRKLYFFRVHIFDVAGRSWAVEDKPIELKRDWFKARKKK